jgi:hypothetical protein
MKLEMAMEAEAQKNIETPGEASPSDQGPADEQEEQLD